MDMVVDIDSGDGEGLLRQERAGRVGLNEFFVIRAPDSTIFFLQRLHW